MGHSSRLTIGIAILAMTIHAIVSWCCSELVSAGNVESAASDRSTLPFGNAWLLHSLITLLVVSIGVHFARTGRPPAGSVPDTGREDDRFELGAREDAERAPRRITARSIDASNPTTCSSSRECSIARSIVEQDLDAILAVDAAGRVIHSNPAASQLLGPDLTDELGRLAESSIRGASGESDREAIARALDGYVVMNREESRVAADGRRVRTLTTYSPVRDAHGEVIAASIRLRVRHDSNGEVAEYAHLIAHDLRAPLRGIRYYADFLAQQYAHLLDEKGRSRLEALPRLSGKLDSMLESLLECSRVGGTPIDLRPVDLNTIVHDVIDSLSPFLEETGAEVRVHEPLPRATCDAKLVRELVANLVTNAAKYNDKVNKLIEIGSMNNAIYVRDNGIGIDPDHSEMIFQVFRRLHAESSFGGGTGTGLTIARSIVARHGGWLWVESDPGEGSTFFFVLDSKSQAPLSVPSSS